MESGWNVWVWLVGVVVTRYIDFLILVIPTPLVFVLFCSSIPTFCSFFFMFFTRYCVLYVLYIREMQSTHYVVGDLWPYLCLGMII